MDVQVPIQKALLVDGESKLINHLICGEYELTNTSWSKLQKKHHINRNKIYTAIKGEGRPGGSQNRQKGQIKKPVKPEATTSNSPLQNLSTNKFLSLSAFVYMFNLDKKTYLFILDKLSYHGTTHYNWTFIV